jgi:hypothetical protein
MSKSIRRSVPRRTTRRRHDGRGQPLGHREHRTAHACTGRSHGAAPRRYSTGERRRPAQPRRRPRPTCELSDSLLMPGRPRLNSATGKRPYGVLSRAGDSAVNEEGGYGAPPAYERGALTVNAVSEYARGGPPLSPCGIHAQHSAEPTARYVADFLCDKSPRTTGREPHPVRLIGGVMMMTRSAARSNMRLVQDRVPAPENVA